MRLLVLVASLSVLAGPCLAQAVAASAPTLTPEYIEDVPWATRLSGKDVTQLYPMNLAAAEKTAQSVVECRVGGTGGLEKCIVLDATPPRSGVEAASLKLTKLMKVQPQTKDGASTAGKFAVMPIKFAPPFALAPITDTLLGQPAFLVSSEQGELSRLKTTCPTATDPQAVCYLNDFEWATTPDFGLAATYVQKVGKTTGRSSADCSITAERALTQCRLSADFTPAQITLVAELLGRFRAKETTTRGAMPTAGGHALVVFDWAQLNKAIELSAVKRPR